MTQRSFWIRYGVAPALLGAACLGTSVLASAQGTNATTTPPAATTTAPSTNGMKPATNATTPKAGEDDAMEFAKLDKNHDGVVDKAEAMLEPRLLTGFAKADVNKDGKIDKSEFLSFERARHANKTQ